MADQLSAYICHNSDQCYWISLKRQRRTNAGIDIPRELRLSLDAEFVRHSVTMYVGCYFHRDELLKIISVTLNQVVKFSWKKYTSAYTEISFSHHFAQKFGAVPNYMKYDILGNASVGQNVFRYQF